MQFTSLLWRLTLHECGCESCLLDGPVRYELDVELVAGGLDVLGHLVAAVRADQGRVGAAAVANLDVVVHAAVVVLDLT